MSMKESIKQKEERTHSEEMQDKLEPIADREDYVNRILKGSELRLVNALGAEGSIKDSKK